MADVVLTRQLINVDGLLNAQTAIDATDVYHFDFDNRTFLHIVNGAGSISVCTFVIDQPGPGNTVITDEIVNVPATDEMFIGPFADIYGKLAAPNKGRVVFSQDQAASVTAGVFRV